MKPDKSYIQEAIKPEEYEKYLVDGKDFIDDDLIRKKIAETKEPDPGEVEEILERSMKIELLTLSDVAKLLNVKDPKTWKKMEQTASEVKRKVYDNRIVFFAPLYISNYCVNNCLYCGFRCENRSERRKKLSLEEVKKETEVLAGDLGHKRLIVVYGEHPETGIDYIVDTIKQIYDVKVPTKRGWGSIRRVNVNAAPFSVEELKKLKDVGIGTYQVFQETYHHDTYEKVHPSGTIKNDYRWRLYVLHRAFEAGIDDVAIGALFGLYDWRFEVMGLVSHAWDLEKHFGIGPHTVSFPRLQPAANSPFIQQTRYRVTDSDFRKIVTVLRLAIPYTGMILTARENPVVRKKTIPLGITQIDASTKIDIGGYSASRQVQDLDEQQFMIGDPRDMDTVIRELAEDGYISSFCTAGYRCGRTGEKIMDLLKTGGEGHYCKLNAILTFQEWLDDFASDRTREVGEKLIEDEIREVKERTPTDFSPELVEVVEKYHGRIKSGERDLYV